MFLKRPIFIQMCVAGNEHMHICNSKSSYKDNVHKTVVLMPLIEQSAFVSA